MSEPISDRLMQLLRRRVPQGAQEVQVRPAPERVPDKRVIYDEVLRAESQQGPGPIAQLGAGGDFALSPQGRIEPFLPSAERGVEGSVEAVDPNAPSPGVLRRLKQAVMPMPLEQPGLPDSFSPEQMRAVVVELVKKDPRLLQQLLAAGDGTP